MIAKTLEKKVISSNIHTNVLVESLKGVRSVIITKQDFSNLKRDTPKTQQIIISKKVLFEIVEIIKNQDK